VDVTSRCIRNPVFFNTTSYIHGPALELNEVSVGLVFVNGSAQYL